MHCFFQNTLTFGHTRFKIQRIIHNYPRNIAFNATVSNGPSGKRSSKSTIATNKLNALLQTDDDDSKAEEFFGLGQFTENGGRNHGDTDDESFHILDAELRGLASVSHVSQTIALVEMLILTQ